MNGDLEPFRDLCFVLVMTSQGAEPPSSLSPEKDCDVDKRWEAVSIAMICRVGPVWDGLMNDVYLGVGLGIGCERLLVG